MQVENELQDICLSILDLLDNHLVPSASTGESKVFYLKMKGDYHRYLAEFKTENARKEAAEHTLLAYKAAQARHRVLFRVCCRSPRSSRAVCRSAEAALCCAEASSGHGPCSGYLDRLIPVPVAHASLCGNC